VLAMLAAISRLVMILMLKGKREQKLQQRLGAHLNFGKSSTISRLALSLVTSV
jgi:hypothetical protein